jgi:hypothetical protein
MEEPLRKMKKVAHTPAANLGTEISQLFRKCGLRADIAEIRGFYIETNVCYDDQVRPLQTSRKMPNP